MKDLDFDELDKAVNSLMANNSKDANAPETPTSVPSSSSSSAPVSQAPSAAPSLASRLAPSSNSSPLQSRPASLAAKRGGRFMDVVHPAAKKEVSPPVSRQASTIQPAASASLITEVKQSEKEAPNPVLSSVERGEAQTPDWPDPLELVANDSGKKMDETKSEPVSFSDTPSEKEASKPSVLTDEQPLVSPFLPDAKVEKRPLGGASSDAPNGVLMVEDENAQLPALPKDVEPALPEELHGDVASIEADNSTTDPSKHLAESQPVAEVPAEKEVSAPKVSTPPKPAVTVAEAAVSSGPTSIPQQYKEEPSSGDQHSGAIYDTDSYHQPLAHPIKKKSGWSWVVWILLILLVGAGSGAALYLLGIVQY